MAVPWCEILLFMSRNCAEWIQNTYSSIIFIYDWAQYLEPPLSLKQSRHRVGFHRILPVRGGDKKFIVVLLWLNDFYYLTSRVKTQRLLSFATTCCSGLLANCSVTSAFQHQQNCSETPRIFSFMWHQINSFLSSNRSSGSVHGWWWIMGNLRLQNWCQLMLFSCLAPRMLAAVTCEISSWTCTHTSSLNKLSYNCLQPKTKSLLTAEPSYYFCWARSWPLIIIQAEWLCCCFSALGTRRVISYVAGICFSSLTCHSCLFYL